jgi:hypothetical protein
VREARQIRFKPYCTNSYYGKVAQFVGKFKRVLLI